jgi:glycerol-3-phosphate dehydrogenase
LLSVLGGKLTTYRRLAERALDRLTQYLPDATGAWTGRAFLPGGVIPDGGLEPYWRRLAEQHAALPPELLPRLVRTYGTRAERLLEGVRTVADLGEQFGAGLYAREVDYLVANEWARTAEDILFRRTKLGLHVHPETAERLKRYLAR